MSGDADLVVEIEDLIEDKIPYNEDDLAGTFSERVSVVSLVLAGVVADFRSAYGREASDRLVDTIKEQMDDAVDTRIRVESLN